MTHAVSGISAGKEASSFSRHSQRALRHRALDVADRN